MNYESSVNNILVTTWIFYHSKSLIQHCRVLFVFRQGYFTVNNLFCRLKTDGQSCSRKHIVSIVGHTGRGKNKEKINFNTNVSHDTCPNSKSPRDELDGPSFIEQKIGRQLCTRPGLLYVSPNLLAYSHS